MKLLHEGDTRPDVLDWRTDMQGRICLPGFVDGHMHLLNLGLSLQKCDLKPCKSLKDIRETIRAYAEENPDVPRILCANWMHSMTGGKALASMIDDLDPRKRPIFIEAKDLHSSWLSSSALEELGVQDERDPEGGTIHRDENGRASGLLSESAAIAKVWPDDVDNAVASSVADKSHRVAFRSLRSSK